MSNERKSTVLLEHHLKQLKLPTMLKEYPLLAKSCSQEKCDYPTYLLSSTFAIFYSYAAWLR